MCEGNNEKFKIKCTKGKSVEVGIRIIMGKMPMSQKESPPRTAVPHLKAKENIWLIK
jgi:hypothetical protein